MADPGKSAFGGGGAMKAGLNRQQMVGAVGGAILLLAAGALAWWGLGSLGEKQAEAQALAERMGNPALAALLGDPAGATRANREAGEIQKIEKELWEKDGSMTTVWSQGTREAYGEGQDWSKNPEKWKDRLIQIQSELQKAAPGSQMQLGPDFYLGLEAYRQKSPSAEEVPGLALHLSVAQRLVERLMEARKSAEQYPTLCEFRALTGPGSSAEKAADTASGALPAKPGSPPAGPEKKSFQAEIRCSPEVLYTYVRLLATDPWLFILTDLSVTSAKETFPLRSEIAKKFSSDGTSGNPDVAGAKPGRKLLEVLAGEESLTVRLNLDFVAWRNPAEAKAGTPPARSP